MLSVAQLPPSPAHNRTRRSRSLPGKLLRAGQLHWLAAYPFLRLSDLVREGMDHSGSYRFADHLYRAEPAGRLLVGRWLDALILSLPASRAFRQRYLEAVHTMAAALERIPERPVRILAIPCGLPRDLLDLAAGLPPRERARIDYHGLDIDTGLLREADTFTANVGIEARTFHPGDALASADYPRMDFDVIVSTGLGEFLDDAQLSRLYANAHAALAPGGVFYTSATSCEPRSEAMLRAFELNTHYRAEPELARALTPLGWASLEFTTDSTGLQTFVRATR